MAQYIPCVHACVRVVFWHVLHSIYVYCVTCFSTHESSVFLCLLISLTHSLNIRVASDVCTGIHCPLPISIFHSLHCQPLQPTYLPYTYLPSSPYLPVYLPLPSLPAAPALSVTPFLPLTSFLSHTLYKHLGWYVRSHRASTS